MKATIKLFKALPITTKKKAKPYPSVLKKTIPYGFVFAPEVYANYTESQLKFILEWAEDELGLTPEQMNNAFHKSWKKISEAPIAQLIVEQLLHYFTTYGFERLGIYNEDSVYFPRENLTITDVDEDLLKLTVIHGYTHKELKEKLKEMLALGIALKEDTIQDILDVVDLVGFTAEDIEQVKNKEVKIALYHFLNKVPKSPVEFLRYIVYRATERTLLIKNKELIELINARTNRDTNQLFITYKEKYGLDKLARIFHRYKPIFLAFKTNPQLNSIINKIRKLAKKHHKPMPEDYLNEITAKIKKGEGFDTTKLTKALNDANTFRKVRLAYALKFRTKDVTSILYKIRNGKGYATDFSFDGKIEANSVLKAVENSIIKDIRNNVNGKTIYIPENIVYSLPATEKQFTGYLPSGTCVTVPKDMIFGIHWNDVKEHRIDLDLSLMNKEVGKIGWDSSYRTQDRDILFSGDVTAPSPINGASELFYVESQHDASYIMTVNYFNYNPKLEVPFKILVAQEPRRSLPKNYMVDPNYVVGVSNSIIKDKQLILGLVVTTPTECKFYYVQTYLGNSITQRGTEYSNHARQYLFDFYTNTISLNELLERAGAELIQDARLKQDCDIDLSPEQLQKDTIINLLKKVQE